MPGYLPQLQKFSRAISLIFLTLLLSEVQIAQAQSITEDRDRGIQLYKQGDTKSAIRALGLAVKKNKEDADAWYYLGLAFTRDNQIGKARKAFETTTKLRPGSAPGHAALAHSLLLANKTVEAEAAAKRALALEPGNPEAHYLLGLIHLRERACDEAIQEADNALASAPNFGMAYWLRSQSRLCNFATTFLKPILVGSKVFETRSVATELSHEEKLAKSKQVAAEFKRAAEDLGNFLRLKPDAEDGPMWRTQLENLLIHAQPAKKPELERSIFTSSEVTTRAQVLAKPEPQYTQAAREAGIVGTVALRAVFASDGTVQNILIINSLPRGLTQQAVNAAQKIKFIPATRGGRPVSMFMQLEYNFNLY